mgnify:CR=1 FL=1
MLSPIVAWRGKPIFVVYRDQPSIDALETDSGGLADPDSTNLEQQPDFAVNPWRSERPEIGVYVGLCTHLGCSPKYVETDNFENTGQGGFFCPCHGSKFDLAGRVVSGVPAPYNLEVPPYRFESDPGYHFFFIRQQIMGRLAPASGLRPIGDSYGDSVIILVSFARPHRRHVDTLERRWGIPYRAPVATKAKLNRVHNHRT